MATLEELEKRIIAIEETLALNIKAKVDRYNCTIGGAKYVGVRPREMLRIALLEVGLEKICESGISGNSMSFNGIAYPYPAVIDDSTTNFDSLVDSNLYTKDKNYYVLDCYGDDEEILDLIFKISKVFNVKFSYNALD